MRKHKQVERQVMKLTEFAEEGVCPSCGSSNISQDSIEWADTQPYYRCLCLKCNAIFKEWYVMLFTGQEINGVLVEAHA